MDLARSIVQQFINDNLNAEVSDLILKYPSIDGVPIIEVANQIIAKNKAKNKIPSWYQVNGLIYPSPLSMEQCSSDETGMFKSTHFSGRKVLDLTGGAGVDSYYLSRSFEKVDYVEIDPLLVELCRYNFSLLKVSNVDFHCSTAEDFLLKTRETYDLIYLDPSRRVKDKKVFRLSDCTPDFEMLNESLFKRGSDILIKTSPLLDIHKALMDLKKVREVFVLGVKNEVKEVLYHLRDILLKPEPLITSVNITVNGDYQTFQHLISEEAIAEVKYGIPDIHDFIYEPNSSILKSGAFKLSSSRWGLSKFHPNTHLNSSSKLFNDYPGRIFRIERIFNSIAKATETLKGKQLNIIARNSNLKPVELKKRIKINDGGEEFLISARIISGEVKLFHCSRVK